MTSQVLILARKFMILVTVTLWLRNSPSLFLSASNIPEDQIKRYMQYPNTLNPDYEPETEKKSMIDSLFKSLLYSKTAQKIPSSDWIPRQNRYTKSSHDLSNVCHEPYQKSSLFEGDRVLGMCSFEVREVELGPGAIPPTLLELDCLCDNQKCSGGIARCTSQHKMVTTLIPKPENSKEYKIDVRQITVGCLCIQRSAPEGYTKDLASYYTK